MRLTRRYRFSASHRLHAPQLSETANAELYGKCNNPHGHGHDYVLDVSVRGATDPSSGQTFNRRELDQFVRDVVLEPFGHANLNLDIAAFSTRVPTTENVAVEIRDRLWRYWQQKFPDNRTRLEKVRVYETKRNIFEVATNGK